MALYERYVDGVKVGRAFTVDGTDEDGIMSAKAAAKIEGWVRVEDEPFDPAAHSVADVLAYLADADEAEVARVRTAEAEGKQRKGVLGEQQVPAAQDPEQEN